MPILETVDLIKQYKQSEEVITAVDRVNLKVEDGEFIAIIGTSGSGKSTLLHVCAGLDRPNSGKVIIRGQDIVKMKADELSRYRGRFMGIVFQTHNLLPQLTAYENITLPAVMCGIDAIRYEEHLNKLIKTLDLENRLNHLPSELSGGQRQRVAIARAMINRPQILFADEPTGSLDKENAEEVLNLMLKTKEMIGQTLIIVTHDMDIAQRADKIYRMDNGVLRLYRGKEEKEA
ncbi:MAG: ABC transporter ATP-binding protein [Ruminococcaceae bacterium]|nr:ABC transporter ATP-binding protein [Oscillospiraceae bacterium]